MRALRRWVQQDYLLVHLRRCPFAQAKSLATYSAKRAGSSTATSSRGSRLGAADAMEARVAAVARRVEKRNCIFERMEEKKVQWRKMDRRCGIE